MSRFRNYLLSITDSAAAGIDNHAAYRNKMPFVVLAVIGRHHIDTMREDYYHLSNALTVLSDLTGYDYLHCTTYQDIAVQILRNWNIIADNSYPYRAASDMLRMTLN